MQNIWLISFFIENVTRKMVSRHRSEPKLHIVQYMYFGYYYVVHVVYYFDRFSHAKLSVYYWDKTTSCFFEFIYLAVSGFSCSM